MTAWLSLNWLTIVCLAAVIGLVALCVKTLIPKKGQTVGCAGCSGSCAGCSGCGNIKNKEHQNEIRSA